MNKLVKRLTLLFLLVALLFSASALLSEEPFAHGKIKVTASVLNVRNISSQGGTVVGSVKRGDILSVTDRSVQEALVDGISAYWYKVTLPDNTQGWIFGGYITFELNLESGLRWRTINPAPSERFTGIVSPIPGTIIAGTASGNLYSTKDNGLSWKKIVPQALGNNIGSINKVVMQKNVIWMISQGEAGGGVWKTANNGATWSQYTVQQGLPSNDINDIYLANDGLVWVVTAKGIATSSNNGLAWIKYETSRGLKGDPLSITMSGKNVILGTTKGVFVLVQEGNLLGGKSEKWIQVAKDQIKGRVESLYHYEGMIYAGTDKGLARSDASSLEDWFIVGGSNKVRAIFIDGKKRVIVATQNGLNISLDKGDSWVTYKKEHGLDSNSISAVTVDANGKIWAALENSGIAYHD